jgi:hypothetical protein
MSVSQHTRTVMHRRAVAEQKADEEARERNRPPEAAHRDISERMDELTDHDQRGIRE